MLADVLKQYWGYDRFLPHQQQAMRCVLDGHDSLVVMPTGGGKSLCYQVPALCRRGAAVVVSPLIALMKDQVDALSACGVPAAAIHSGMAADHKRAIARELDRGKLRLLYLSPERLVTPAMLDFLARREISFFAIDEAHCISAWGHDFRPEYRGLAVLRERFPDVGIHAYTATATERVRDDIVSSLRLRDPQRIVGSFHRPNLAYRVSRRDRLVNQVVSVLERFRGQSGLVYCISRAETEELSRMLSELGYSCHAYHAGLSDAERSARQEDFTSDRVDTIVATVAFGMGIDKSNVRYVIHAGMPKSLANYQQETGRAGRDGLEAECWLLYSPQDVLIWKRTMLEAPEAARESGEAALQAMYAYCVAAECRHRLLLEHFGESFDKPSCGACDICLGQLEQVDQPMIVGQKILSCVMRLHEGFGAGYVAQVLAGSKDQRVLRYRHDRLSTYGLLKEFRLGDIRDWIEQLVGQGYLQKQKTGEYAVLKVTDEGRCLLRGERQPKLLRAARRTATSSPTSILNSWEGVDRGLFEQLRQWRREVAERQNVGVLTVFGDATLRDLARRRPTSLDALRDVHGMGDKKVADYGLQLVEQIGAYCREHGTAADQRPEAAARAMLADGTICKSALAAFPLFDRKLSVAEVARALERAESTGWDYLCTYLLARRITDPQPWLAADEFEVIRAVARYAGLERLKPIHQALHGRIGYEHLRVAVTILQNQGFQSLRDCPS